MYTISLRHDGKVLTCTVEGEFDGPDKVTAIMTLAGALNLDKISQRIIAMGVALGEYPQVRNAVGVEIMKEGR